MTTKSPAPPLRVEPFDYEARPVRVVFGPGRITEVPAEADRLGLHRIMVIADSRAPGAAVLLEALGHRISLRWHEIAQHVPIELAERAVEAAAANDVDGLISLGGGSATGLAKAIALDTGLPILAVPTTYAGSELTPVYGMTGAHRKRTGTDERVRPAVVVYDPELTFGLPPEVTGPSAFNAMAHCFAALWSPRRDPLTSALAVDAVRSATESLPVLMGDPSNVAARSGLQYAAFLAGTALGRTGTGLQHKICHELGGRLGLSHADTHAVVLPHIVALNAPAGADWAPRLHPFLGPDPAVGLWELARGSGLPTDLASLGASSRTLREVAEEVAGTPNPVPVDTPALEAVLRRAMNGEAPR
ncbi:maleylacetate reductase [Amycolatopsis rhabdoformis]|uniref:Maleylacetate reductase n=1 Tax=Amycolatopsis rhabdoformis TaxID=1448059 RepID=A0ABZ1I8L6_9PSEU|nr:maleylacetate reductase [Amycolatopsis rhabdoformis]WSE29918.1 maleylacetate reductase [Amycolatopsis rhabdoformis]